MKLDHVGIVVELSTWPAVRGTGLATRRAGPPAGRWRGLATSPVARTTCGRRKRLTARLRHRCRVIKDAAAVLAKLGGAAPLSDLDDLCGRAAGRRALLRGEIRRLARGRYALPAAPDPRVTAVRLAGVV